MAHLATDKEVMTTLPHTQAQQWDISRWLCSSCHYVFAFSPFHHCWPIQPFIFLTSHPTLGSGGLLLSETHGAHWCTLVHPGQFVSVSWPMVKTIEAKIIIRLEAMFKWFSAATSATFSLTCVNKYGNICWTLADLIKWKHGINYEISITWYIFVLITVRCLNSSVSYSAFTAQLSSDM